jgi:predicted Zn-dependent protease
MTSIKDYHRNLEAAQGYCELGMSEDALAELASVPGELQAHATVVELRLIILMQARRWKAALSAGRELTKIAPQRNIGYIHSAFCLHELGQTDAARKLLLDGPETLHAEPVFHYNLACYECMLGQLAAARQHLDKSFQLDKKFRDYAKTDPDLEPLREKV